MPNLPTITVTAPQLAKCGWFAQPCYNNVMPNLPTITVTTAQANKLLDLFGDAAEYKKWLKEAVRQEAIRRQTVVLSEAANNTIRDAIMAFEAEIPPPDEAEQA